MQPGGVQADQAEKLMAGLGLGMKVKAPLTVDELASRLEKVAAGTGNRAFGGGGLENRTGMIAPHIRKSGNERPVASATTPGHSGGETKNEVSSFSLESNPAAAGRAGAPAGETVTPPLPASVTGAGGFSEQPALKPGATAGIGSSEEVGDGSRLMTAPGGGHEMHGKEISVAPRGQERVLPSYVADQVGRQIHRAVQNGDSEIRFQVNPSALGKIRMSLERTREGLKVVIVAEQSATRDLLMAGSHDIKALLSEQGVKVDRIDVDVSGSFDQSLAGAKQESGDSRGRRGSSGGRERGGGQAQEVTSDSPVKGSGRGNGILDLVA